MLSVEDWAEIRRLHRSERLPIKAIARLMGVSRNTVCSALAADGPPKYQRAKSGSIVDIVEPRIRELLHEFPTMPATVIAERIGWDHSIAVYTLGQTSTCMKACRTTMPRSEALFSISLDHWKDPHDERTSA